ncbi:Oxidoreductase N-terminal [Penicillium hordei]|jgi:hypothetical protein|uniref:Oxidoreductase N-terminal n=1 Tax=Penicillium hordei TaxID=40994 RepID=A0AAD6DKD9_9EURO|nr:Oxidoreductase N-terminal [Penicillium hordei]KAJ5588038.1 Oxidoreductase N-terminal [Penicillium hordei]
MAAIVMRVCTAFVPPKVEKNAAIRFGILGARPRLREHSNDWTLKITLTFHLRPLSFITPALSYPEVIVQVVAARDHARASAFAKKHNIPDVRSSYNGA